MCIVHIHFFRPPNYYLWTENLFFLFCELFEVWLEQPQLKRVRINIKMIMKGYFRQKVTRSSFFTSSSFDHEQICTDCRALVHSGVPLSARTQKTENRIDPKRQTPIDDIGIVERKCENGKPGAQRIALNNNERMITNDSH